MSCDPKALARKETQGFNWVKEFSVEELEIALSDYDFPEIKTTPYQHQLAALLIGLKLDDFMFYLDMGLGKTAVMLWLIAYLRKHNKIRRALIVVPDVGNIDNWNNETRVHTHLNPVSVYGDGTKKSKRAALEQEGDLYIINYMGLHTLMTDLMAVSGGKKRKRMPSRELVDDFASRFDLVVFDEIQYAGNPNSLLTELCLEVAAECEYRYGLTGTPFGRDLSAIWSQFMIVDGGRTFGDDFECFQRSFYNSKIAHFRHASVTQYTLQAGATAKIKSLMESNSLIYDEKECNNLPKQIFTEIPVRLGKVARELYAGIVEQQLASLQDEEIEEVKGTYSKFRQLCSGFYYEKDKNKQKQTIMLGALPKLEQLLQIIEDSPKNSKIVVFHVFQATGNIIRDALIKAKISHVNINHNAKDKAQEIRDFVNIKSKKVAIANLAGASTGLNLQVANYCITFEPHDDPKTRQQSLKRIHRTGQKKTTYYYDFICTNTVEEKVRDFLIQGKSLKQAILNPKSNVMSEICKDFSK